ncbi:RNA 2',3'-cyclic phosphodiesterase [Angustibacter sp. McL0619]|uniref:RNA 2',3'-cyclic phosphodiesterase n=1 Tax=Angustibacter sp. McL0619 TaxID=3415676 RepID=UPI003CECCCFD
MRMFVALTPSPGALQELADFVEPRRDADPELRWSSADQWHVTLAFLPDVPERSLDDLQDRLARAALRRSAFGLSVSGGGAFPDVARARVLYAGLDLDDETELDRLATGARAAANRAGAGADGGRFRPHLTLARSRHPHDLTRWVRVLESYRGPLWWAEEIRLVRSRLGQGPGGRPVHELVEAFPLSVP